MKFMNLIIFVIIMAILDVTSSTRHIIYWDNELTPTLNNDDGLTIDVSLNDWMDILCPHYQSDTRLLRHHRNQHLYLQIYNVTEDDYTSCNTNHTDRVLFCNDPSVETKLTTKFQRISPSPLGFVFKPGHTYYYISRPVNDQSQNCHRNVMKLKVRVSRKHKTGHLKSKSGLQTYHVINTDYKLNNTKQVSDEIQRNLLHHTKSPKKTTLKLPHSSTPQVKRTEEKKPKVAHSRSQTQGGGSGNSASFNQSRSWIILISMVLLTVIMV